MSEEEEKIRKKLKKNAVRLEKAKKEYDAASAEFHQLFSELLKIRGLE